MGEPPDVALDLGVLARLLGAQGVAVTGDLRAARVGRGQSNLTYLVSDEDDRRWVVRRPPLGELLQSAHDVRREYRILSALRGTTVPVPEVHACFEDPDLADAPVVVMEHVEGLVVDREEVATALDHDVRAAIGPELARTLATVHEVDLAEVGLLDLASHRSYAARQLKRWSGQWEASRTRDLPALDAMTDLLRRVLPEREELRLVHGDFHIRNVITDPGSGRIRGVLDWELATLGDPMADIGSLLAYWPQAEDPGPFSPSMLPGFADRATLAAAYLEASGRDPATLDFWHALGLWKIAVIAEGVLRRTTDDPRNTAEGGAPRPEFVEFLVERAWNVASAAGLDRRQSSTT